MKKISLFCCLVILGQVLLLPINSSAKELGQENVKRSEINENNRQLSETSLNLKELSDEPSKTGTITLRYVDTFGNQISNRIGGYEIEPEIFTGNIGDYADDDLYYFDVAGWVRLGELPKRVTYEEQPQTFDVVYENGGTIYINYKDTLGNELKSEERNTDYIDKFDWSTGDLSVPYEITDSFINGYKNIGTSGDSSSGIIEAYEIKRVTFIYDKIDKKAVNVHDSSIYVGDSWSAQDNFDNASDKDGNSVEFSEISISGAVDTQTVGVYNINYSYDGITSTAEVNVMENKESLKVKNSTIQLNSNWKAEDNLASATDKDGNALTINDLEVEGSVDTSKPDTYSVMYKNGSINEIANVTVEAEEVTTYQVTFDSGKGGRLEGEKTINVPAGTKVSDIPNVIPGTNEIEDIYFLDWYHDGKIVNPEEIVINENTSFTAKFGVAVYRLYNPNNGDHLLTKNKKEKNDIAKAGWKLETTNNDYGRAAFYAPVKEDTAGKKNVYRIYNPNSGEHFYTTNKDEADAAVKVGWRHETNEDYTWVSDGDVEIFRQFNPDITTAGSHNFTTNLSEHETVIKAGWIDETKSSSLWKVLKAGF